MTATAQEVRSYREFLTIQLGVPEFFPHLTRLLADGAPFSVEQLAAAAGLPAGQLQAALEDSQGMIEFAGDGRIKGLKPTPHKFTTGGTVLYATCASHALQFPVILGQPGVVESACPVTGQPIHLQVTPRGIENADPPQTVVSKVRPASKVADIAGEICAFGSFFSSPQASEDWLAEHRQGIVVGVAGEFDIIRQTLTGMGWAADRP